MADDGDPLTLIVARDGVELTARHIALDTLEAGGHHIDTRGVSDEEDLIGELLGTQVQVEDRAIGIDDQLGGGDDALATHIIYV